MIIHRSRFLTQGEVWYDEAPPAGGHVDRVIYHRRSHPVPGAKWRYTHTPVVNLSKSVAQLQEQLSSDTAYKIRRARERDKIKCVELDVTDPQILDEFEEMHNAFAALRGLCALDRGRLVSMAAAGRLDLSAAADQQGSILVYHGNYRGEYRATSLYSVSLFRTMADATARSLISRANRYLFWTDLVHYKEKGLRCFDFGGWHTGTNEALLKINRFKDGFGGEIIREYECDQIVSLKGRVVLNVAALLNWAQGMAVRLRGPGRPRAGDSTPGNSEGPLANPSRPSVTPALAGNGPGSVRPS